MQVFKIRHETFDYLTTDKDLVIARVCSGFTAAAVDYYMQPIEQGKPVRVVDYGTAGKLLSY